MGKRAFGITNSEISMFIWVISFLMSVLIFKIVLDILSPVLSNPSYMNAFVMIVMLLFISQIMSFSSMFLPNYLISKYNLNVLVDRIKNPDFMGWVRFTRNKRLCFQIIKNGPLGQTKGMANGEKADVINNGSYTITTPCGNQAILKSDLLSHNINLEQAVGWSLIHKHYGLLGFRAWEKAENDGKLFSEQRISRGHRKPLTNGESV